MKETLGLIMAAIAVSASPVIGFGWNFLIWVGAFALTSFVFHIKEVK